MISEREYYEALREAAAEVDGTLTKAAYEGLDIRPAASTIRRQCGGWNAAKARECPISKSHYVEVE